MKTSNELLKGLAASLLSSCIVIGALALSTAEDLHFSARSARITQELSLSSTPEAPLSSTQPDLGQETPQEIAISEQENQKYMLTMMAETPGCTIRMDWQPHIIQPGDLLIKFAETHLLSIKELKEGNCLSGDDLLPGNIIFLPMGQNETLQPLQEPGTFTPNPKDTQTLETSTPEPFECIPPEGWSPYIIKENDTLLSISQQLGMSIFAIKEANCLSYPLIIEVGDILYLPPQTGQTTPTYGWVTVQPGEMTPNP